MPMPKPNTFKPNPASLSFHDLMQGVGRGHAMLAQQPGAQMISSAERAIRPGEMPIDVLARMQKEGRFVGKGGEPLTYRVLPAGNPAGQMADLQRLAQGELPKQGVMSFMNPKTKAEEGRIYMKAKPPSVLDDPAQIDQWRSLPYRKGVRGDLPLAFNLDTMSMPAGVGRAGYAAMLDAIRAGGDMNYIDILTGINQMRRPGNVMSHGIAHGDYNNVPLFEGRDYNGLPFEPIITGGAAEGEERALKSVLSGHPLDTATRLDAQGANKYSDEAKTGLLALKEMQAIKGHTEPDYQYLKGIPGQHLMSESMHAMDPDQIARYVAHSRQGITSDSGGRGIRSGFGAGVVGRAGTTEALLRGLQEGKTTEEIVQELLKYPGADEALKGRYKKGGLAHAAIEA